MRSRRSCTSRWCCAATWTASSRSARSSGPRRPRTPRAGRHAKTDILARQRACRTDILARQRAPCKADILTRQDACKTDILTRLGCVHTYGPASFWRSAPGPHVPEKTQHVSTCAYTCASACVSAYVWLRVYMSARTCVWTRLSRCAQRLGGQSWPTSDEIRMRMSAHTPIHTPVHTCPCAHVFPRVYPAGRHAKLIF